MTTIKLRRGLAATFATNNPVLQAGEPAFATDTGILKIGDGTTAYNSLPSIGASPDLSNYVQKTDYASTVNAGVIKVDGSTVTVSADGTISAVSSAPSNMVTTDTTQTITGAKTFTGANTVITSNSTNLVFRNSDVSGNPIYSQIGGTHDNYGEGLMLTIPGYANYRFGNNGGTPGYHISYQGLGITSLDSNYSPGILFAARAVTSGNIPLITGNNRQINIYPQQSVNAGLRITSDNKAYWYNSDGTTINFCSSFTGADGTNAGTTGLVPAPAATDNNKFLKGDGTWAEASGGGGVQIDDTNASTTTVYSSTKCNNTYFKNATTNEVTASNYFRRKQTFSPSGSVTTDQAMITLMNDGSQVGEIKGRWDSGTAMLQIFGETNNGQVIIGAGGGGRIVLLSGVRVPRWNTSASSANTSTNNRTGGYMLAYSGAFNTNDFTVTEASDGESLSIGLNNVVKSSTITNMVKLTQAEYDALATKDANTFYVIVATSS